MRRGKKYSLETIDSSHCVLQTHMFVPKCDERYSLCGENSYAGLKTLRSTLGVSTRTSLVTRPLA